MRIVELIEMLSRFNDNTIVYVPKYIIEDGKLIEYNQNELLDDNIVPMPEENGICIYPNT